MDGRRRWDGDEDGAGAGSREGTATSRGSLRDYDWACGGDEAALANLRQTAIFLLTAAWRNEGEEAGFERVREVRVCGEESTRSSDGGAVERHFRVADSGLGFDPDGRESQSLQTRAVHLRNLEGFQAAAVEIDDTRRVATADSIKMSESSPFGGEGVDVPGKSERGIENMNGYSGSDWEGYWSISADDEGASALAMIGTPPRLTSPHILSRRYRLLTPPPIPLPPLPPLVTHSSEDCGAGGDTGLESFSARRRRRHGLTSRRFAFEWGDASGRETRTPRGNAESHAVTLAESIGSVVMAR